MVKQGIFPDTAPLVSRTWGDLLDAATTPEEVLVVARNYLSTWEPLELTRLATEVPPPGDFQAPEDLVNYAFELLQCDCGPAQSGELLTRMTHFFSHAAQRVAVLMGRLPAVSARNDATG